MGKYSSDLKTIAEVLLVLLIVFSTAFFHNELVGLFSLGLWGFYLAYRLVKKIEYKHGLSHSILFPTLNDSYFKSSGITIGVFIIIGDYLWYRVSHYFDIYILLVLIIGILFLLNGIYSIPNGQLIFNKGTFLFNGMDKAIHISEVMSLKINKSSIVIFSSEEAMTRVVNLMLDEKYAELIKDELIKNGMNPNSIIVNLVD